MEQAMKERRNKRIPSIEEIHCRLLEMAKAFHCFCMEHQIPYYVVGGTALGAKRHQGFIPWDDDMDIGIPRKEFERLALLGDQLPGFLELRWYRNTEKSPFQFIKLVDNRTTLIENNYTDYAEGLYIDIFPLDGAKPKGFWEKMRWRKIWLLHHMIIIHASTKKKLSHLKKIAYRLIKLLNVERLQIKLDKVLKQKPFDESPYFANFLGAWGKKEIMPRELLGKPTLYTFEDTKLFCPEHIEEYLSHLYGDFMKLPPPEQRVLRHDYYFLDLHLAFREYEKQGR